MISDLFYLFFIYFSLITNETCFALKSSSHQTVRCANHVRDMFILIMIETTSRGSFNYDRMKHVKNGEHAERRRVPKRSKSGPTMRPNVYLKYGPMLLVIKRQLLAMG